MTPPIRDETRRRLLRVAALVTVTLLTIVVAACDRREKPSAVFEHLQAIPYPSLAGAEPGVQAQVAERQTALEEVLAALDPDTDPGSVADSFAELGLIYVVYDFPDAATVCFDNARQLVPDDYRWAYLSGYVRQLTGEVPMAIQLFEQSLEMQADFLPALLRLGRSNLELGNIEEASVHFDKALSLDGSSPAALEGLGKIAVAEGRPEIARDYFERALIEAPRANSLHYALAQVYRDLGRLEDARRQLELSGDANVPIPDPLISPLAVLGESAQLYIVQGTEALADQNYELAAAAYRKVLEKDERNFIGYKGLSYALEKLGDLEGAILNLEIGLERATTGKPENDAAERAELHRVLGGLEAARGRDDDAIRHFERSLTLKTDQPGVRMKLGNALARRGRFAEALPHFTALIETQPEFEAEILVRRATALINLERGEEGLADFRRAIELRPSAPHLRLQYADALEHLGRNREASGERRIAGGVAGDADGRIGVLFRRATKDAKEGRFQSALDAASSALELDPERFDIRYLRATLLAETNQLGQAVEEFRRVIDAEPRHPAARHAEITALVLLERYGEARVRLNEALRLFSLDAGLAHLQARLLATCPDQRVRDGRLAAEVARRLVEGVGSLRVGETLALALAASGESDRAAQMLRELLRRAQEAGDQQLAADVQAKLPVVESGGAWSAAGPREILDAARDGV